MNYLSEQHQVSAKPWIKPQDHLYRLLVPSHTMSMFTTHLMLILCNIPQRVEDESHWLSW